MSVTHDFECYAHGVFTARVKVGVVPRCPRGCSPGFVHLVFVEAPAIASERVRHASRLVREMADVQGLSDIDVSPSTPGGSVAEKNFKRLGLKPEQLAYAVPDVAAWTRGNRGGNDLVRAGFGHAYNAGEWRGGRHAGAGPPLQATPPVGPILRAKEER